MPQGGRIGDKGGFISFWHEVTFLNWHDLGFSVYFIRQPGPGYEINLIELEDRVEKALESLKEDLEIEKLKFYFRVERDESKTRYDAMNYFMYKYNDFSLVHDKIKRVMTLPTTLDDDNGLIVDYSNFFSLPGGHLNPSTHKPYVIIAPPPYYAVSHSHPSTPLICGANSGMFPGRFYYNRVTLEHYVSYWTYSKHTMVISVDSGLGDLGKDIAKNVIFTAAKAANLVYLFDFYNDDIILPSNVKLIDEEIAVSSLPKFTLFVGVGTSQTLSNLKKVEMQELSNILIWEDTDGFDMSKIKFNVNEFLQVVIEKTGKKEFTENGMLYKADVDSFTSTFCGESGVKPDGTVFQSSVVFFNSAKDAKNDVEVFLEGFKFTEGWDDVEYVNFELFKSLMTLNGWVSPFNPSLSSTILVSSSGSGSMQVKITRNDQAYRDCVIMNKVIDDITPHVYSQILATDGSGEVWSACFSQRLNEEYVEWNEVWNFPKEVRNEARERLRFVKDILKEMRLEHRDVHSSNVLVNGINGDVKVIDFTWATRVGEGGGWDLDGSEFGDGPGRYFTFPNLRGFGDEGAFDELMEYAEYINDVI